MKEFLLFLIVFILYIKKESFEKLQKQTSRYNFSVKNYNFSVNNYIPNIIHKIYLDNTMGKTTISPDINFAINTWKDLNPGYTVKLWYGDDCINYLKKHFSYDHLECFTNLSPYAYKADFMRYCIIYNEGGWYSDWQQKLLVPLDKINNKNYKWVSCYDTTGDENKIRKCMQNSFFGSIKNNDLLKKCIDQIILNTKNTYYGYGPWDISGPCLLGDIYSKENPDLSLLGYTFNDPVDGPCFNINNEKVIINKCCTSQNIPGSSFKNGNNYIDLWKNKKVYNTSNAFNFSFGKTIKSTFGKTIKSTFGKINNKSKLVVKVNEEKNSSTCILLTTCVFIKTSYYNKFNTSDVRLKIYLNVIDQWLKNTNLDIKIVESSEYPFLEYVDNPRIEIYSFKSNNIFKCLGCDATPYEAESILLAFNNLNLKQYDQIIKITGKYYLPNFEQLIKNIPKDADIFFQNRDSPLQKSQNSEIFGCKTIYLKYIMDLILLNSQNNLNFESTIYSLNYIKINNKKMIIYKFPRIYLNNPVRRADNSILYDL
jgi:mannosyltransferase OCH1-like enzyme